MKTERCRRPEQPAKLKPLHSSWPPLAETQTNTCIQNLTKWIGHTLEYQFSLFMSERENSFPGIQRRLNFINPLWHYCLTRAAGTAGGRPARHAVAATQLATAAPFANTKTGKSTTTSVVKAYRDCQGAVLCLWEPHPLPPLPHQHPLVPLQHTLRALLQGPCPWQARAVSQEGLAVAVAVSLPAPRRAAPAVSLDLQLQLPLPYWMPPLADTWFYSIQNQTEESSSHAAPSPPPLLQFLLISLVTKIVWKKFWEYTGFPTLSVSAYFTVTATDKNSPVRSLT